MNKDILLLSTVGKETEISDDFLKAPKTRKTISLSEYKENVSLFWKKVKEKLLVDCADDEIYSVTNQFRDDISSEYGADIYSTVCKKYKNIEALIYRAEDNLEGDFEYSDEDLGCLCFWSITKYRLINNDDYEMIFTVFQTFLDGFLEIYFDNHMLEHFTPAEKELYKEWLQLSGVYSKEKVNIEFPYKKGDIIKISGTPYQNRCQYYVCYDNNSNTISRDQFGRLCEKMLFSQCDFIRFGTFVPCFLEKADPCEDKVFNILRKMILSSSDDEIENFLELLHCSFTDDYFEYDKRMRELEQRLLEIEDWQ